MHKPLIVKALIGLAGLAVVAASLAACATPVGPVPLASRSVKYGHVQIDLPPGWTVGRWPSCGPQPDTVAVQGPGPAQALFCPYIALPSYPVKTLAVMSLYDSSGARGWTGDPINWEGQQAWLVVEPAPKPHMSASALLTLPWLNTQVQSIAPDVSTARALLDNVHVYPATTLEVPASADSVVVSQADGARPLKSSNPSLIKMLLTHLKQLEIAKPSAACTTVMKSGPQKFWTITFTKTATSTMFMLPMSGCKQVTSGTGVVALTNNQFWFDFNKYFETRPFGSPLCCAPAPTVAPKNSFYFDGESYIYPAPVSTIPGFTRQQLLQALATQNNRPSSTPQVFLVMSKGPYRGSTAPTSLMWVARYQTGFMPRFGCGLIRTKADLARCARYIKGQHPSLFSFYDANTGLPDMTIQMDGSKVAPGHLTFDQWVATYKAARG